MYCSNCGKEIQENIAFCPECGAQQHPANGANTSNVTISQQQITTVPYNSMSIIGIVISVISLFLNFWGLVGIAGTIISVIGLDQCGKKNENGKALAIIGIVIGVCSIFYGMYTIMNFM